EVGGHVGQHDQTRSQPQPPDHAVHQHLCFKALTSRRIDLRVRRLLAEGVPALAGAGQVRPSPEYPRRAGTSSYRLPVDTSAVVRYLPRTGRIPQRTPRTAPGGTPREVRPAPRGRLMSKATTTATPTRITGARPPERRAVHRPHHGGRVT